MAVFMLLLYGLFLIFPCIGKVWMEQSFEETLHYFFGYYLCTGEKRRYLVLY